MAIGAVGKTKQVVLVRVFHRNRTDRRFLFPSPFPSLSLPLSLSIGMRILSYLAETQPFYSVQAFN